MATTMRAVQSPGPGKPFEVVERPIPEPTPGTVRIRVHACGICHSDSLVKEGHMPGLQFPRIPGHEVAGVIDAVASDVTHWKPGQRVGVGWHGGYCAHCMHCRRGDLFACNTHRVTGLTMDGGYAEYMLADATSLAAVPDGVDLIESAPLMCAGITTFNALRNSGARPGDLVAILGVGGLGHLGVQYARAMGFNTVAIARGTGKRQLATDLGAHHYIDSAATDPGAALQALGGANVILATVTHGPAMTAAISGLGINGTCVIVGAAMSLEVPSLHLLGGRRSVKGWYSGTAIDSQDTMAFSAVTGIKSMNEVYPLEKAGEAYDRMMSGNARFRVVLSTGA
ncbi:MAG: alcohol dehydrogenase [Planctomycetota bacterium]